MFRTACSLFLILALPILLLAATPPQLLNYQGVLKGSADQPLTGTYDMTFRFYDGSGGGTLLLTDTHTGANAVAVSGGIFNAALGAGALAPGSEPDLARVFANHAAVWMEVQVGTETLSPRVRVVSEAYAENADTLDGSDSSAFALSGHMQGASAGGTGLNTSGAAAGSLLVTSGIGSWATLGPGGSGQLLQSTGSAVQWVSPTAISDGDWTISGSNLYSAVPGNVGIGAAGPARKLQIGDSAVANAEGMIRLASRSGTGGANRVWDLGVPETDQDLSGTGYSFVIDDTQLGTTPEFLVKWGTGNVGIGTIAPDRPLTIRANSTNQWLSFKDSADATQWHLNYLGGLNVAETGVADYRLFLKDGGNVGIGNPNPGYRLDVSGDARISGALRDSSGAAGTSGQVLQSTGTGTSWVNPTSLEGDAVVGNEVTNATNATLTRGGSGTAASPYTLALNLGNANTWTGSQTFSASTNFPGSGIWNTSGNVGIGTPTPGFPLNFPNLTGDKISLFGASGNHYGLGIAPYLLQIHTDGAASDIAFGYGTSSALTETMRIKGNGNLGIGMQPSYRLDVSGDARISGALRDSSGAAGTSGQVLKSTGTGTSWVNPASLEGDAVVGNEVTNATNATLTRSGSGTVASPYTLALNLGNANTWTGSQTFSANTNFPGSGIWNTSGNVGIGTSTPQSRLDVEGGAAIGASYAGTTAAPSNGLIVEGSVGVGVTAPTARLHVRDTLAVNGALGELRIFQVAGNDDSTWRGPMWQSWTFPLAGSFLWTAVEIRARSPLSGTAGTATLRFYEGEGTGGTLLGTTDIAIPDSFDYHIFALPSPVALTYGAKYTLSVTAPAYDQYYWRASSGNPYTGGISNIPWAGDYDFEFGIYIATSTGVGFKVNANGSVGVRTENTDGYALAVNGTAAKTGGGSWSSLSDLRLKDLAGEYAPGLKEVLALRPYHYRYKDNAPLKILSKGPFVGPVAQEVQKVIPEAVETGTSGYLLVNNDPILWATVNAVKELDARTRGLAGASATGTQSAGSGPAAGGTGLKLPAKADDRQQGLVARKPVDDDGGPAPPLTGGVEQFPVCESVDVGDVLVTDPAGTGRFCLGRTPFDRGIVGIATGAAAEESATVPVATSGIVYCKVDASYGPVGLNDLLCASPTPGHAMRADDPRPGTVLGKAIEPLDSGTGVIRVLVMLR